MRNALHELSNLLASLHHEDGSVAVAGFYAGVKPLSDEERRQVAVLPFSEEEFVSEVAGCNYGEAGFSLRERVTLRPCIDVNGMWGGYTGEGGKTIIPSEAHAKLSIRVVPGQDPAEAMQSVMAHLQSRLRAGVQLRWGQVTIGAPASSLSAEHPLVEAAAKALLARTGQAAVPVRLGASVPITSIFKETLGIDTLMFGHNLPDEDVHAPNEFFRLQSIEEGLLDWTAILRHLGAYRPEALRELATAS